MKRTGARPLRVQWWLSAALVVLLVLVLIAMTVQGLRSQQLVEHKAWREVLESATQTYLQQKQQDPDAALPQTGILQAWYVGDHEVPPAGLPPALAALPPGHHSDGDTYHAWVSPMPAGKLISRIDISEVEAQQNRDARLSVLFGVVLLLLVGGLIVWLHANLLRPVRDLAARMQAMDPAVAGQRLPTQYRQEEFQVIARAANAHLERVAQFIEREKTLLDQASHEFRTPVAVISSSVDVLRTQDLPATAWPVLKRISLSTEYLSEIMFTLLSLAREAGGDDDTEARTAVHVLLPELVKDHEYLLLHKHVTLQLLDLHPTHVGAPEAMVRIAVGNVIRNAAENTHEGRIDISLRDGRITVTDSGRGLDLAEVARRYRESLRNAGPTRGQGLGLFLIRRICDRFNWRFDLQALDSGGTQVTLDLNGDLRAAASGEP